ncbi:MAG: hypothetical protein JKX94_06550, partial [Sneathiella sp.]|nr:hypothetical protein [Sneathiella sp.]
DELSKGEKRQIIANENRVAAQSRALQALGYDRVDRDARNRHMDFYALSAQIKALSRIIDSLAAARVISKINPPPSVPLTNGMSRPVGVVDMSNAYGPEGPTERAVKLLAEYQLMRNGNKRLKVGEISDQEKFLTLNIVTIDGSLVEQYKIDKLSGAWSPVREP